jgi:hypothetical protein
LGILGAYLRSKYPPDRAIGLRRMASVSGIDRSFSSSIFRRCVCVESARWSLARVSPTYRRRTFHGGAGEDRARPQKSNEEGTVPAPARDSPSPDSGFGLSVNPHLTIRRKSITERHKARCRRLDLPRRARPLWRRKLRCGYCKTCLLPKAAWSYFESCVSLNGKVRYLRQSRRRLKNLNRSKLLEELRRS